MNPNQKIITIGIVNTTLSTIALLIGVGNLVFNTVIHEKIGDHQTVIHPTITTPAVPNCSDTIITYNNTVINNITTTIITEAERPFKSPLPLCPFRGFFPFHKDNAIRLGENKDVIVTREPYVSCDNDNCWSFALAQGALLGTKHSNGTIKDRTPYRSLIRFPIGTAPVLGNYKEICIAWSSSSCFDGKEWMHVCMTGNDNDASGQIIYAGKMTDSIKSWRKDILRTQESECQCIDGTCVVAVTDGPAANSADHRVYWIREGRIIKYENVPKTKIQHLEECSCYVDVDVYCICRDNWKGSNRPWMRINNETILETGYVCSKFHSDTPRPADPSTMSCDSPSNVNGGPGVKGFGFKAGNDVWLGRTVSTSGRSGFEIIKVTEGWINSPNHAKSITQTLVSNNDWSGYSGSFIVKTKDCFQPCFYVELIRGRPNKNDDVSWTSNSIVTFCGLDNEPGSGNWPDGSNIGFMPK
ncbi:neuraminidase [Influenza A virus (A/mallard/Montana/458328-5/2006(H5N3))]|uniref:Neuraminidase n=4 Tax=Influenza A virus TaxID=11320 RepID=C3PS86_9INFA|nr:neuraminidase [Influenza A virus (A/mallard/Alberta/243/2006(H7N3))]ACV90526.1 neuraminidase [Influenza A virus (A/mallard/Montana/458329-2/2006(H5N3))]ACZ45101.1 neuraminidase [Influenza A virus (A/mallard/Montana/456423/2006(H5N3))]ACZ45201.1 neuraminidase [Influenza A virus (A/mallard/Montana/458328-5/2006(H5N3))]AET77669.1 neuraminidase [Influenza A virus (A/mallard/Alberta/243/2006(H7N3))]